MMRASVRRSASWLPWARTQSHQESGPRESYLDAAHPELGTRFSLIEALGSGGMGIVYRAFDRELGHEVALKLLHVMSAQDRLRLKEEFRTLSELAHPNLVNLYELIANERTSFFTMELVNGTDFVEFAQAAQRSTGEHFPEVLRDAARQLALALHALHTNRKLHRDVKPSNVLVTSAGRVVLLDFGLVTRLSTSVDTQRSDGIAGTIDYMAPEQAWGKELTAAADWYGFGVTLFEALKGELPIAGSPYELAMKKLDYKPSPLRSLGFDIPAELDQLLLDLLDPEPLQRPKAERIMACLGEEITRLSFGPAPSVELPEFVGREDELSRLARTFDQVLAGSTRVVEISGPSGIGKSSLVREFLERSQALRPTLVLASRCHPRESVAFNAIDGLIDDLSRLLPKLPLHHAVELAAEHRAALLRVFPILGRAFPLLDDAAVSAENPKQLRHLAFTGLRELLVRVAAERPVVLWIDDVHWGDEDSGFVLRELLRPPLIQGLLVILGYRAEDRQASACLRVLADEERAAPVAADVLQLELGPLGTDDGMRILREGVPASRGDTAALESLLQESGGSPFFLSECVRYLRGRGSELALPTSVGLEDLLRMRTQGLPEVAGAVLEVFCVAGAPIEQGVALRAAGLREADRGIITTLERVSILRTTDPQRRTMEVYHHRIRDDLLRRLPSERTAALHVAIGSALLTTSQPNPLAAVDHFEAAKDHAALRKYIVAAAHQASRVLAFDRAAKLYQRAIELESSEMPPHELHRRLGLAFAHAGRGREAGQALLEAARLLDQTSDPDADQIIDLKQLASEQFLQTAHYAEGMAALREVLADLDVPFPSSRREALRKATALRLWSMVRGVRLPQGSRPAPSPYELRRFDALWATSHRLSMVDFTLTSYATVRTALDAVRLGEPSRMIRALAHEGCNSMAAPGDAFKKRGTHLIELASSIVTPETSAGVRSFLHAARGIAAWFLCDFQRAVELLDAARELLRPTVRGVDWELALQGAWAMIGLAALGETRTLLERATVARQDAEQRDDRFQLQLLNLGPPAMAWLVADRARAGIEQADRALSWAPSDYTTQHYEHYVSCVEADLYLGEGRNAWRRTLLTWPQHRQNHLLVLRFVGDILWHARARAAVGAAETAASRDSSDTQDELRAAALQAAREMERHGIAPARGWALTARAAVAHQEGRVEQAAAALTQALSTFDEAQMQLDRECTRFRLGELLGGDEGRALTEAAERFMRAQAIRDPAAMARMVVPGFGA